MLHNMPVTSEIDIAENDLKELTTHVNNEPSLLERAQQTKNISMLHQYFLRLANYFKNNDGEFDTEKQYATRTILYYAIACFEEPEVIIDLLKKGSRSDEYYFDDNDNPLSAFYAALQFGNIKAIKTLLTDNPELAFRPIRQDSATPAHYAAETNNVEILKTLYESNPNITRSLTHLWNITPLHAAAIVGQLDAARWLLEHDAELCNMEDGFGKIALHDAVINHHPDLVKLVLENKANTHLATNQNWEDPNKTALQLAVQSGNDKCEPATKSRINECVRLLLFFGAQPDAQHPLGDTSKLSDQIQIALKLIKYQDIMKSLLDETPNYDCPTQLSTPPNMTPLQIAATTGDNELFGKLFVCDARPTKEHPIVGSNLDENLQYALSLHVNYLEGLAKRKETYKNFISEVSYKFFGVNPVPGAIPKPFKMEFGNWVIKNLCTGKKPFDGLNEDQYKIVSKGQISQPISPLIRRHEKELALTASAPPSPGSRRRS